MTTYTFHLQTEYQLRDFEAALALREITGILSLAKVPADAKLRVGPKLYQVVEDYGCLEDASEYAVKLAEEMSPRQVECASPIVIPVSLLNDLTYIQQIDWLEGKTLQSVI